MGKGLGVKVEPSELARAKMRDSVAKEREIFSISGKMYDVTEFSKKHPGGAWISKFAGQDVTCLFESFHPKVGPAEKYLKALEITTTSLPIPAIPLSPRHRDLNEKYIELAASLEKEGAFKTPLWFPFALCLIPAFGLLAAVITLEMGYNALVPIALYGWAYGLAGLCMHHAGHLGVFGRSDVDLRLQQFVAEFVGGVYAIWWRVRHNRHHAAPNDPELDPDLETVPLLLWHKELLKTRKYKMWANMPIVRQVLRIQRHMFFIYLTFYTVALHGASRLLAFKQLKKAAKRLSTVGVWVNLSFGVGIFMFTSQPWYRWVICWVMGQWITGIYLGWNFALNHFPLPLCSAKDSHFCEAVLRTTLNVRYTSGNRLSANARFWDFMTGYLGYQVEHHLFPRMPACNYPIVHERVKAWVEENNLGPFVEKDWISAHNYMVEHFTLPE
jgi:fatty acid desaturase